MATMKDDIGLQFENPVAADDDDDFKVPPPDYESLEAGGEGAAAAEDEDHEGPVVVKVNLSAPDDVQEGVEEGKEGKDEEELRVTNL